ncbi:MAG: response regulator transcription factor [Pseudomonadota bacterium]
MDKAVKTNFVSYPPLTPPYRVLVLDDHQFIVELLSSGLSNDSNIKVVGVAKSGEAAISIAKDRVIDIALLDMALSEGDGISVAKEMLKLRPGIRLIGLSAFIKSHYPQTLLEYGARGFIGKNASVKELLTGIRRVANGELAITAEVAYELATTNAGSGLLSRGKNLSPREKEVLELIAKGYGAARIANELGVKEKTVAAHRSEIRKKLELSNDVEICLYALRSGLVSLSES